MIACRLSHGGSVLSVGFGLAVRFFCDWFCSLSWLVICQPIAVGCISEGFGLWVGFGLGCSLLRLVTLFFKGGAAIFVVTGWLLLITWILQVQEELQASSSYVGGRELWFLEP